MIVRGAIINIYLKSKIVKTFYHYKRCPISKLREMVVWVKIGRKSRMKCFLKFCFHKETTIFIFIF